MFRASMMMLLMGVISLWVGSVERPTPSTPLTDSRSTHKMNDGISASSVSDESSNQVFDENYQFERKLKVVLNTNEVLTDVDYAGFLHIHWDRIDRESRKGIFSLQVTGFPETPVSIEAKISNDFKIDSIMESIPQNENEETALLFLKDWVSIYAWNTSLDTTGPYVMEIKPISTGSGRQSYLKKKIRYLDSDLASYRFKRSVHEIEVMGWQISAKGVEETEMGSELFTQSLYELKPSKVGSNHSFIAQTRVPGSIRVNPNVKIGKAVSWEEVREEVRNLRTLGSKERMDLFHKLVKMLRHDPNTLRDLMNQWSVVRNEPSQASVLIGALATSGSIESQAVLLNLFRESVSGNSRNAHLILNALATSRTPLTSETLKELDQVIEQREQNPDLAANAILTLGAGREIERISALLNQAKNREETLLLIDALGNSGDPNAIPQLMKFIRSADEKIREKSVFALRLIQDERARDLLQASLSDPCVAVRNAALMAMSFRTDQSGYSTD